MSKDMNNDLSSVYLVEITFSNGRTDCLEILNDEQMTCAITERYIELIYEHFKLRVSEIVMTDITIIWHKLQGAYGYSGYTKNDIKNMDLPF